MPHANKARYRRILRFAARHLVATWWFDIMLPSIGLGSIGDRNRTKRFQNFARKFRALAVDLGGLMIKVGQFMSSRLDVLPPEMTKELEGLQDEVPAVPFEQMRAVAERQLGMPLESVFATFDPEPVAAASLGQAYRARLTDADAADAGFAGVVVKIQRPGISEIVEVDLAALRVVGRWLNRVRAVYRRVNAPGLVEEFAVTSLKEIDYLNEASNAERFADNFANDPRVRVPGIAWERSTRSVLTLEDVSAIKITDRHGLRAAGIDPSQVAHVFAAVMFDQFFEHGFFHADPHPGNMFVRPTPGEGELGWELTFVDFGMMGEIPDHLRSAMRALIIASAARDGRGMVKAFEQAGVLLPNADVHELERVMTQVFARFGGMGVAELRELDPRQFRDFAMEFGDVLVQMPFQLPEDYLLLIRAVSLTSGVATALDAVYNAWDTLEPYAAQLLREESGKLAGDLVKDVGEMASIAWRLPGRIDAVLQTVEDGRIGVVAPKVESAMNRLEHTGRRLISAMIFGALLVSGALVHGMSPGLGVTLMVGSVVPLLHVVFGRRNWH
ncbi:AarF/UbiB family protein [Demequina sp. B12]|uniref:ABC1 kinase family protein n=1 Tax=Demequina sp. B12 TaxID=2992757 RepID=UPI00237B71F2|nr:AarF/UbiB family protein [Demequina sp. B12]MDE0573632.1 AarF/UbiB family protein [Demequina sp. B12]